MCEWKKNKQYKLLLNVMSNEFEHGFLTLCSIVFGLFEWKRICAGFLSFVYMYSRWDPITRMEGWGLINDLTGLIFSANKNDHHIYDK
jgi:hypothetical protein